MIFFVQLFLIILYELDILTKIIGYSDWDFYRTVLLTGRNEPGFVGILNSFHNIFGTASLYIWYSLELILNSILLSALLKRILEVNKMVLLYFLSPFFILFYSGIYKEVLLLDIVILFSTYSNFFTKLFSTLTFGIVRSQLIPFIVFLITNFKIYFYLILSIIAIFVVTQMKLIDFKFIGASINEIRGVSKSDFPIEIMTSLSPLILLKNMIIILFGYFFINSIFLKILYFFSVTYFLLFYFKNKLYKLFFSFIIGLLPYSLLLTNAGTALRILTFLFISTIALHFLSNRDKSILTIEKSNTI